MAVTDIEGDLFDCPKGSGAYLVHQCNCTTQRPAHLSYQVFKRFPQANIYRRRKAGQIDPPGRIIVVDPIVNLLGQLGPGKPWRRNDTSSMRYHWFCEALQRLNRIPGAHTFSFPHGIGCGAAGGAWDQYRAAIDAWAGQHPHLDVRIYQLPN